MNYDENAMRKSLLVAFLIAIMISGLILVSTVNFGTVHASPITINADKYLASVYDATLKLLPETAENNVYWITSDNLLAYYALQNYSSDISNSIKNTIMVYAITYGLPKDSNGLPIDYKHEAVIGDILTQQFGASNTYRLVDGSGYTVRAEVDNGSVMLDWANYSDLVAYKGLSYYNQGDIQDANNEYNLMMQMWNGHGFNDTTYNSTTGLYDTYKLALAWLLARDCQIQPNEEMYNIISSMQDSNGGIHTQYTFDNNLAVVGSVNTETTALVAIANITVPFLPSPTPSPTLTPTLTPTPTPEFSSLAILILFMVAITIVAFATVTRKGKKENTKQNLGKDARERVHFSFSSIETWLIILKKVEDSSIKSYIPKGTKDELRIEK